MDFGVALGPHTSGLEARAVNIVEVAFGKLRLSQFFMAVDILPRGRRGEGEFFGGNAKDRACTIPLCQSYSPKKMSPIQRARGGKT